MWYSQGGLNHSGARTSSESHESLTSEDRVRISTSAVLTVKSASRRSRSSSSVWSTRPPGEGGGPAKSGVVGDSSPSPDRPGSTPFRYYYFR